MADETITKRCPRCKIIKSTNEFSISRFNTAKDKLQTYCKLCHKIFRQTPQYRKRQKVYSKTKKGREIRLIACKKYYAKYPERLQAKNAIAYQIRYYGFPKPSTLMCVLCKKQAQEYHHYLGYTKEHWLDVRPVCKICHKKIHSSIVPSGLSEQPNTEQCKVVASQC